MGKEIVKNAPGSSKFEDPSCKCSSWIKHWDANSSVKLNNFCRACGCNVESDKFEGGHVRKVIKKDDNYIYDPNDRNWYIVPLCKNCNDKKDNLEPFEVDERVLVSVNCSNCKNK